MNSSVPGATIEAMPRRYGLLLVASLGSLTCAKDAAGPILAERVAVAGPDTVYLGETGQFRAVAFDAGGTILPSHPVTWSSSDTTIAVVAQSGLVTARAVGTVSIQATADGKIGARSVSVVLVPVNRVNVFPSVDSLFVGDSIQLNTMVSSITGRILTDRLVAWRSSDTTKATVSTTGFVRTRAPGSFTITARVDSIVGGVFVYAQLRVTALAMPDSFSIGLHHSVRLIPDLRSASGTHLSGRAVVWTSLNPLVLDVTSSGVVQPHDTGSTMIVVRSENFYDTSLVRVIPEPVTHFRMSFISSGPFADTTVEAIEAAPYDTFDFPTVADSISWTSSDTTVLKIAPSPTNPRRALLTGVRSGSARLTARSGAAEGSLLQTVKFPMVRFVAQPDSVTIHMYEDVPIGGYGLDRFGNPAAAPSNAVTAVADTAIAVASQVPVYVSAVRPGRTLVYLTFAGGIADTVPVIVRPANTTRITWANSALYMNSYSASSINVWIWDSTGNALLSEPRDMLITSSDTSVAVVYPESIPGTVTPTEVTIETRKAGSALITAGIDSQFAVLWVTVYKQPPISVQIDAAPPALVKGGSLQLNAVARRFDGVPRPFPITWATSNPDVATVSASGVVNAVSEGRVFIRASSDTASDVTELIVVSSNPPTIGSIAPSPLVPGATITITGSGFDPNVPANSVLVDGVAATVTSATPSELVLQLPPAPAWPCRFDHEAHIVVTSGGRAGLDSAQLQVASTLGALAPGDTVSLDGDAARCTMLAPVGSNAWYVVLAANTDPGNALSLSFAAHTAAQAPAPARIAERPSTPAPGGIAFSLSRDSLRRSALTHRHLLEQSRALSRRAGAPAPLLRAARQMQPQRSVSATINGVARVRIPKLEDPDFCSSYRTITARVVYAGAHVVILEDNAAPLAGTMDYYLALLGQEFDGAMYPKLLANFGNPLAMDSLLDRDGRIAMVISPVVNTYGVSGFVVSCDFYPESVAPSSNTGEVFYTQAAITPGTAFSGFSAPVWHWLVRSVAMHEAKHLTAYAERLSRGAPIEETWLEESSAVLAEDLWSRDRIYFTTWKGDASYRSTIYCDVRPTWPECKGRPYSMFNAFAFLYDYVTQLDRRTPLGPTSYDDATFYGSGWSFLRWAIDQTSTDEAAFLRQLTQEPALSGVPNLEARTQRPLSEMLPEWADALYYDSWGLTPPRPSWSMPSWRMDDIFAGMRQDFPSDFPDAHPVHGREWVLGSPFEWKPVTLAPGGWALLTGNGVPHDSPELVNILSGTAPLPPGLHVQIIRVR